MHLSLLLLPLLNCALRQFGFSKLMWNVTNNPPAAFPLKSLLCQKHKMSTGRIFSAAAWPRSSVYAGRGGEDVWVCVCVRGCARALCGGNYVQLYNILFNMRAPKGARRRQIGQCDSFRHSIRIRALVKLITLRQPYWLRVSVCVFRVGGCGPDFTPP